MSPGARRALGVAAELLGRTCAVLGLGFFAWLAVGNALRERSAFSLFLLGDQALNVAFVVAARWPTEIDRRPHAVLVGVVPTFSNLFLDLAHGHAVAPAPVVDAFFMVGILVQLAAKLSLRRSFGIIPANRGVKTGGAFRVVRHPMYVGYAISQVGTMLGKASVRNVSVILGLYGMLALRAWLEERVLMKDEAYRAYAERVRWRLIPFVW